MARAWRWDSLRQMKRMHFAAILATSQAHLSVRIPHRVKRERATCLFREGTPVPSCVETLPQGNCSWHRCLWSAAKWGKNTETPRPLCPLFWDSALGRLNCFFYKMKMTIEDRSFSGSFLGTLLAFYSSALWNPSRWATLWRLAVPNSWPFHDCPLHIPANSSPCSSCPHPWTRWSSVRVPWSTAR